MNNYSDEDLRIIRIVNTYILEYRGGECQGEYYVVFNTCLKRWVTQCIIGNRTPFVLTCSREVADLIVRDLNADKMGKLTAGGKLRESCLKAKRLEEIGNIYGINAARSAQEINNLKELNSGVLLRVREIDAALEKERKEADRFISVFDKKADKWIPICIAGYTVHHVKEYTLKEVTAYIEKRNTTKPRERIIYMQDKEACRWVEVRTKMSIGAVAQAAKGEDLFLAIFNEATKERGVICTAGYIVQTTNPMTLKEANRFNDVKNENCKVFERIKSYDHRADAFARFVKERKDAKHMNNYSGCL